MTIPDDAPVPGDIEFYRRVPPGLDQGVVRDDNKKCLRLSSAVFAGSQISVYLEDALRDDGRSPLDILEGYPGDHLVAVPVQAALDLNQSIKRNPEAEEAAHGEVSGPRKTRKKLRSAAVWLAWPDGLCDYEQTRTEA